MLKSVQVERTPARIAVRYPRHMDAQTLFGVAGTCVILTQLAVPRLFGPTSWRGPAALIVGGAQPGWCGGGKLGRVLAAASRSCCEVSASARRGVCGRLTLQEVRRESERAEPTSSSASMSTHLQPPPEGAAAALRILQGIQTILREGRTSSTLKFAVLQAIADCCVTAGDDTGARLELPIAALAERVVELYWPQAAPFGGHSVLLQAPSQGSQPTIIKEIAELCTRQRTIAAARRDAPGQYQRVLSRAVASLRGMPLRRLEQVPGAGWLDVLYPEPEARAHTICLYPWVACTLRMFHGLVSELVQTTWLRSVHASNQEVLGDEAALVDFLFGSERTSLDRVVTALLPFQNERCFYCGRQMRGQIDVDHFIPWSRFPSNLGHNLVLAHAACNGDKANTLAAAMHLQQWIARAEERNAELCEAFERFGICHARHHSYGIARWAYGQAAQLGSRVWLSRGEGCIALEPEWESVFPQVAALQ